jgi:hypothetical protein
VRPRLHAREIARTVRSWEAERPSSAGTDLAGVLGVVVEVLVAMAVLIADQAAEPPLREKST